MKKTAIYILIIWTVANLFKASASDEKVIAKWNFRNGKIEEVGKRFNAKLYGNTILSQDSEGNSVLFMPESIITEASGLRMSDIYKELTPNIPFTLEVKFRIDSNTQKQKMMLWDSKYILAPMPDKINKQSHSGFSLLLRKSGANWVPSAYFGYGNSSLDFSGKTAMINDGKYHTLRLEYSPAMVRFLIDGKLNHSQITRAPSSLAPAVFSTVIGDRVGSDYLGFEGAIATVTLKEMSIQPISISHGDRTGFIRLEKNPELVVIIGNQSGEAISNLKITAKIRELPEIKLPEQTISLNNGLTKNIKFPLNSKLKPDVYHIEVKAYETTETIKVRLAPERTNNYPVVMWGNGNSKKLSSLGFTHALYSFSSFKPDPSNIEESLKGLNRIDNALADNIYLMDSFWGHRSIESQFPRIRRDGKPYEQVNLEASNPEAQNTLVKIARNTAATYGHHPAYEGALIQSEVRDRSNPSFSGIEELAYREYSGNDIPSEVSSRNAPTYRNISGFPTMRVVQDDHPLLEYYRWWWRTGDGWNTLQSAISKAMHQEASNNFWTFYDPAVRVPPLWGSGGDVNCINQWSYTDPDPIKVGQATDEMLAMHAGNTKQMVMKMTQAFWYRNNSAPMNKEVENPPKWLKEYSDAKYISISPDHLRIAFWSKIARRLDGIMYHGYSSLVEPTSHGYKYTNPDCAIALDDLTKNVIKPLGPLLKRIPERRPEVAILQSFTTSIFTTGNTTFGWGKGWNADIHLALQWAQYQPSIIYEEHIMDGVLDQVDVLVLPAIEILTESIANSIHEFQLRGGIVISDKLLVPSIMPDILVDEIKRISDDPKGSKKRLQGLGAEIRKQLNPYFQSSCEGNNPDIIPRLRSWKRSDYLFIINDKRTFGDYVGQWGKIMEKGLSTKGEIIVNRRAGAVYDLISNREVKFKSTGENCIIPIKLEAGGGGLFLIAERPFGKVTINHQVDVSLGNTLKVDLKISDDTGKTSETLVPLKVSLLNPKNEVMPGSGYFCAEDGVITIKLTPSLNELPGIWKVIVKNLASGQEFNSTLSVNK